MRCCGADGPDDYNYFGISPPPECINRWEVGGRDFERGCANAFSVWLKGWAGGMSAGLLLAAAVEV